MTSRATLRRTLGIVAALAAAWIVVAGVRWARRDDGPSASSDLGAPRLFIPNDLTVADLEYGSSEGVPVLCYHYFREGITIARAARVLGAVLLSMPTLPDKDYWTVAVPEFDRQMRWLHQEGYRSIGLNELADWMEGHGPKPERAVVITIDDGDESLVHLAAPVLARYGFHATVFLLTGRAGERDWNELDFADWESLRRLEGKGVVRVESHTHDMHTRLREAGQLLPRFLLASTEELSRDLLESRRAIRNRLGHDARYLAWPFGFGAVHVDSVAHSLGFRRMLTLLPVRNLRDFSDPSGVHVPDGIGRYAVTARTSMRVFRLMVEGGRPSAHSTSGVSVPNR